MDHNSNLPDNPVSTHQARHRRWYISEGSTTTNPLLIIGPNAAKPIHSNGWNWCWSDGILSAVPKLATGVRDAYAAGSFMEVFCTLKLDNWPTSSQKVLAGTMNPEF